MVSRDWLLNQMRMRIDDGDQSVARARDLGATPRKLKNLATLRKKAVAALDREVRAGKDADIARAKPAIDHYMYDARDAWQDRRRETGR